MTNVTRLSGMTAMAVLLSMPLVVTAVTVSPVMTSVAEAAPAAARTGKVLKSTGRRPTTQMCRQETCVKREPFVCKGPVGSCGFAQGRCLQTSVKVVPCGKPDVVR